MAVKGVWTKLGVVERLVEKGREGKYSVERER